MKYYDNITETDQHASFDVLDPILGLPFLHIDTDVMPLTEACAKCTRKHRATVAECQELQRGYGLAQGFTKVLCPQQFFNEVNTWLLHPLLNAPS